MGGKRKTQLLIPWPISLAHPMAHLLALQQDNPWNTNAGGHVKVFFSLSETEKVSYSLDKIIYVLGYILSLGTYCETSPQGKEDCHVTSPNSTHSQKHQVFSYWSVQVGMPGCIVSVQWVSTISWGEQLVCGSCGSTFCIWEKNVLAKQHKKTWWDFCVISAQHDSSNKIFSWCKSFSVQNTKCAFSIAYT